MFLYQDSYQLFEHKPLWPLDERDFIALGLGAIGLIIAALGGTGGGGVLVPLYIIVLGFHAKQAVSLSNITILGGAIANVAFALTRRHPYCDRPLIAWDLILIMEPIIIFGAVLGSLLNKLFSNALLESILVLLYSLVSYQTMSKAFALVAEEGGWTHLFRPLPSLSQPTTPRKKALSAAAGSPLSPQHQHHHGNKSSAAAFPSSMISNEEEEEGEGGEEENSLVRKPSLWYDAVEGEMTDAFSSPSYGACPTLEEKEVGHDDGQLPIQQAEEKKERENRHMNVKAVKKIQAKEKHTPFWKPILLTICFIGMASLRIAQRSVQCASLAYWLLALALIPWVLPLFLFARRFVLRDYKKKFTSGYPFAKGDVRWTRYNSIKWPLASSLAGLMSGMLGSSGGTIKAPLLIEMGVGATITSATVATMILYTSGAATVALVLFGLLPYDYGIVLSLYGFILTAATNYATTRLLGKRRKQSLAMLCIGLVISISTFTVSIQAIIKIVQNPRSALRFQPLCHGQ